MNAYSSEGASLRARVPPECPAAVMIMVSCHITHWNVKPGKAARVGQRNLRNEKVADVAELFLRSLCPLSCVPAQPSLRPRCRGRSPAEDRQHCPSHPRANGGRCHGPEPVEDSADCESADVEPSADCLPSPVCLVSGRRMARRERRLVGPPLDMSATTKVTSTAESRATQPRPPPLLIRLSIRSRASLRSAWRTPRVRAWLRAASRRGRR